jgi:YVTN family beta-propeller protein
MAQNMVYRHTVTAFNATTGAVVKTIPASVQLSKFGFAGHPGTVLGAPVEGAFTPDAKYFWITNYSMYGPTMGPEGLDSCTPYTEHARGETPSYAMRINVANFQIDRVVQVGYVPKFVETSPDGKWVLVTNWCSWTLNIIDATTAKVVKTLPLPGTPRGIAVDPTSHAAYVAIMGGTVLVKVNLLTLAIVGQIYVGQSPRTVVLSPNGIYAYVSLNGPGEVVKVDLRTGRVIAAMHTGSEARSLVISSDGTALFVVNYGSSTMTMLRASDLRVLQNVAVPSNPIGITFDPLTAQVWVSSYSGYVTRYSTQ